MSSVVVEVPLEPSYDVRIGPDVLAGVAEVVSRPCAIAADEHALGLHGARLAGLESAPKIRLPRGEAAKDFDVLEIALQRMASEELDRSSTLVVLGGGAALDLGGLAASLYMRGIAAVYCPTTLLAQVDASVGGKTAVNLDAGKNLAGTFHQPRAVFADVATLATLPEEEFRSGLGEVVKHALIEGEVLLARIEALAGRLLARDLEALTEIIAACVRTKARIVASDEREQGPRKQLNLGHTFAHAIEHVAGYGRVPHGVAVAVGLMLALQASRAATILREQALIERMERLLTQLGLPRSLAELRQSTQLPLERKALWAAMRLDKKGRAGRPRFVLLANAGDVRVDLPLESQADLDALLR